LAGPHAHSSTAAHAASTSKLGCRTCFSIGLSLRTRGRRLHNNCDTANRSGRRRRGRAGGALTGGCWLPERAK
jgi:hypothetical protein